MKRIQVIYWSQSGNTKEMADAIGEGIQEAGAQAEVIDVSAASVELLTQQEVFAIGCPAMGAEVLEESEMEPFITDLEKIVSGKKIALFGSYSWGDGQWMRDWVERMSDAGAIMINEEGTMAQDTPDSDALERCRQLGAQLAAL